MIHIFFSLLMTWSTLQPFEWVSFDMNKRVAHGGKTSNSSSSIVFTKSGRMVSRFISPIELIVINNRNGEIQIYNPKDNAVFNQLSHESSTENANIYYFLMNQTDEMGLGKLGFVLNNSRLENKLLISIWKAPKAMQPHIADVELVQEGKKTIFMGYRDAKSKYIKKVYFYNYENIGGGILFPKSITEIDYDKKDSIVAKTSFDNIRVNAPDDKIWVDFQIPENAKLLK